MRKRESLLELKKAIVNNVINTKFYRALASLSVKELVPNQDKIKTWTLSDNRRRWVSSALAPQSPHWLRKTETMKSKYKVWPFGYLWSLRTLPRSPWAFLWGKRTLPYLVWNQPRLHPEKMIQQDETVKLLTKTEQGKSCDYVLLKDMFLKCNFPRPKFPLIPWLNRIKVYHTLSYFIIL